MTKTEKNLSKIPQHIAIIMDGNGRWASNRLLPRSAGHKKGAEVVEKIAKAAKKLGVNYLTLYAFSTENWKRSAEEVSGLMNLLRDYLKKDFSEIQKNNIRIKFIGEMNMLDKDIVESMQKIEAQSAKNDGVTLCLAISYGSRQEILNATKKLVAMVKRGDISENDVDEKTFSDMLYTHDMPDPDVVIRTSGEQRISNYLLWQIAYAELFFTDVHWPDFDEKKLEEIIELYATRERRYGKA